MEKLTPRQHKVLTYLYGCEHSTRTIMRRGFGSSLLTTVLSLEARDLVTIEWSPQVMSRNFRVTITEKGRAVVAALS